MEPLKALPCPFCGKEVDFEDADTLYPTGTCWRDDEELGLRTYHRFSNRKESDSYIWGMHCPEPSWGCGAEIQGHSKEEAVEKWNNRINLTPTQNNP